METINTQQTEDFLVGDWYVHPALNRLTGPPGTRHLEPRVMRVLVSLAEQAGRPVSRDDLLTAVWGDVIVTEDSLTRSISDLRKLLGDDPQHPRYIETIRKVGYRLIAPVQAAEAPADSDSVAADTLMRTPAGRPPTPQAPARLGWWGAAGLIVFLLCAWLFYPPTLPTPQPLTAPIPLTTYQGTEQSPALSPDGSQVAFTWAAPGTEGRDLYLKRIGTETPQRLTFDPGYEVGPAWSPDGTRLAYLREGAEGCHLIERTVPGDDERLLAPCTRASSTPLAWSADGQSIFFADQPDRSHPFQLFRLDLDTRAVAPLTSPPATSYGDLYPAVSPNGRFLAFMRGQERGALVNKLTPATGDVFVRDLASGQETQVTQLQEGVYGLTWADDDHLLFAAAQHWGVYRLWEVHRNGGPLTARHTSADLLRNPRVANGRIVFEQWDARADLWAASLTDTAAAPTRRVASTRWDVNPDVSPDGLRLAFASTRSGHTEIWTSQLDGSRPLRLTSLAGPYTSHPRWSPDGKQIVFIARQDGNDDLYLVPADGGTVRRLTHHPATEMAPSWSPDGSRIYFGSNRSGSWQIWEWALASGTQQVVIAEDGLYAQPSAEGTRLFFTRRQTDGLWQYDLRTGLTTLLPIPLTHAAWGNWLVADERIYYTSLGHAAPAVRAYDLGTGTERRVRSLAGMPVELAASLSLTPDRSTLIYAQMDQITCDLLLIDRSPH